MDMTTALTGALPLIILVSAGLTALVSVLLLKLYRRAVIRSMGAAGGSKATPGVAEAPSPASDSSPLTITVINDEKALSGNAKAAYDFTSISLRQLGTVYGVAGAIYALVLSMPWMLTAGGGFPLVRLLWLFVCYAWPAVIVFVLAAATAPIQRKLIFAGYFSLVVIVGIIAIARNPDSTAGQLLFFWLYVNGGPTLLLATFLSRRVRAVGPLVLIFMVAGVTGAVLLLTITGNNESVLRAFAEFGHMLGFGASAVFALIILLGFVILGLLGWWLLGRLGSAYRSKRMSDQSLNLDALWLMFAVLQSITLTFEGWPWIFTGLVAFVFYKLITRIGFGRLPVRVESKKTPSLLLLRVFALGRRSEQLFDNLSKRWLRAGSIDMIAGPDLAASTIEPHEFLDFMGGHLSRSYINNPSDLDQRFALRDTQPDPDGRYRVNEFFCRNDTWQMCMQRLVSENDVVLMDLRSFSPSNKGCLWELEQLLTNVSLEGVLFVIDETTDQAFLEKSLQSLWSKVPVSSPNNKIIQPQVELVSVPSSVSKATERLNKRLFQACYSLHDTVRA